MEGVLGHAKLREIWREHRSRVVLCALQHKDSGHVIYVASCHLEGTPSLGGTRLKQMRRGFSRFFIVFHHFSSFSELGRVLFGRIWMTFDELYDFRAASNALESIRRHQERNGLEASATGRNHILDFKSDRRSPALFAIRIPYRKPLVASYHVKARDILGSRLGVDTFTGI